MRAELDLEERRTGAVAVTPPALQKAVPEDVASEQDREARVATEDQQLRLTEGRPPIEPAEANDRPA